MADLGLDGPLDLHIGVEQRDQIVDLDKRGLVSDRDDFLNVFVFLSLQLTDLAAVLREALLLLVKALQLADQMNYNLVGSGDEMQLVAEDANCSWAYCLGSER